MLFKIEHVIHDEVPMKLRTGKSDIEKMIIDSWGQHRWSNMKVNDEMFGGTKILLLEDLHYTDQDFNVVFADVANRYQSVDRPQIQACGLKRYHQTLYYMSVVVMPTEEIMRRLIKRRGDEWMTTILRILQHNKRELQLRVPPTGGRYFVQPCVLRGKYQRLHQQFKDRNNERE